MTWLTWQGIRDLATHEAVKDGTGIQIVEPLLERSYQVRLGRPRTIFRPKPLTPGAIVFARDTWRAPWRAGVAALGTPSVLVTVFSDAHVQPHATAGLLDGTQIQHWFAVQCATQHPQLTAMPLGIDGRMLPALRRATTGPRDTLLYVNLTPRTPERQAVRTRFAQYSWVTTDDRVDPDTYLHRLGRSRFVLSPPGRGWDCYRTYEALAMGAIPIVRRQPPLSDVVAGLPVLLVDDWHEVTRDRLETFTPTGTLDTLALTYWQERIQTMARTVKARSEAVDNIASGSAITTHERTINGAAPSTVTDTWGNTENIAVATDYSADENLVVAGTNLLLTERRGS